MTEWPRFPNAPIVEAILDIRVRFGSRVALSQLADFYEVVRDHFPVKEERVTWEGTLQVAQQEVQQAVKRGPEGFIFRAADGRRSVQARQDGFTFNWLRPYDRWPSLRDEAKKYWERYVAMFRPESVTRVALRYINRLELPLPVADFREYVLTGPEIAPELPQGLRAFFMRLELLNESHSAIALVSETLQPVTEDGRLPFIFDIDAIREATFEPQSTGIWDAFEQLREYKNEIFFKSMTEKAKELFK